MNGLLKSRQGRRPLEHLAEVRDDAIFDDRAIDRPTKQPPERFGWLFTKSDYYRSPVMRPDLDALQKNVDMTKDLGFVKASFDVKAHSDLSLIDEAAKRLK